MQRTGIHSGRSRAAAVDCESDAPSWYGLLGSSSPVGACHRQFLWTGDADCVHGSVFRTFYGRRLEDFVHRRDRDGEGLPGHRGIATYNERVPDPRGGGDLAGVRGARHRAGTFAAMRRGPRLYGQRYPATAPPPAPARTDVLLTPATPPGRTQCGVIDHPALCRCAPKELLPIDTAPAPNALVPGLSSTRA